MQKLAKADRRSLSSYIELVLEERRPVGEAANPPVRSGERSCPMRMMMRVYIPVEAGNAASN
jgi:hypothetical protein